MPDLSGKTALVTGASSGIGAAMARRLASWNCDLVLTARRLDRLEALAAEVTKQHGVRAHVVREDLSDPAGAERLHAAASSLARIDMLINNAGIAAFEHALDVEWERHRAILQLDVITLVDLSWRFARDFAARGERSYILNVASTAAIAPVVGFAVYGAAKAFVLNFSQALAAELKGTGVTVTAVTPGPVASEFMQTAGMEVSGIRKLGLMSAERCAAASLRAMLRGRRVVAPGFIPKIMLYGSRLTPNRINSVIGGAMLGAPRRAPAAIGKPAAPQ
jgi:uncharacterized protein